MKEDERIWAIKGLLFDYVKSPSLRHIRDPNSIFKLSQEIVRRIDQGNSIWRKWDGQREVLLKSVPVEDLRDFLNNMPGTDVAQRLKAFEEEECYEYPKEEFRLVAFCCIRKKRAKAPSFRRSLVYSVNTWSAKRSVLK